MSAHLNRFLGVCILLLLCGGVQAKAYEYPFTDPLATTVLSTPEEYAELVFMGVSAVDKRHRASFRYYQSGSPFEYDMIRMLYTSKRQIEIAK